MQEKNNTVAAREDPIYLFTCRQAAKGDLEITRKISIIPRKVTPLQYVPR